RDQRRIPGKRSAKYTHGSSRRALFISTRPAMAHRAACPAVPVWVIFTEQDRGGHGAGEGHGRRGGRAAVAAGRRGGQTDRDSRPVPAVLAEPGDVAEHNPGVRAGPDALLPVPRSTAG